MKKSYKSWMKEIDNLFLENYEISYHDLPDLIFTRDLYDDELESDEAYEIIVQTLQDEGELSQ